MRPYLVVMPTYNEAANLPRIVPAVLDRDDRFEVLVVDDASPDGTGRIADELAQDHPGRVHVIHREGKQGLGSAYVAGFEWALAREYELIFEMDADFSHDPDHLEDFVAASRAHDLVVGSRYLDGRVTVVNWPITRLLLSYFGTQYARIVTGLPVSDATSGYKCFHRSALEQLDLERVASNGYVFQIELTFRAWKKGLSIGQIPIVFEERTEGESKMSKKIVLEAVWKVWQLRLLSLLGRI
jgi:dolichol-phosphate mannosyltransferase